MAETPIPAKWRRCGKLSLYEVKGCGKNDSQTWKWCAKDYNEGVSFSQTCKDNDHRNHNTDSKRREAIENCEFDKKFSKIEEVKNDGEYEDNVQIKVHKISKLNALDYIVYESDYAGGPQCKYDFIDGKYAEEPERIYRDWTPTSKYEAVNFAIGELTYSDPSQKTTWTTLGKMTKRDHSKTRMDNNLDYIRMKDYSYNSCIQDQKKTFEAGNYIIGTVDNTPTMAVADVDIHAKKGVWETDGLPYAKEVCKNNDIVAQKLQQCKDNGIDVEMLYDYTKGNNVKSAHAGGSCFLGHIDHYQQYCNPNHTAYKGFAGYKGQRAPRYKTDGTLDIKGYSGDNVCSSMNLVSRLKNEIDVNRQLASFSSPYSSDFRGLINLKKDCDEAGIGWEDCNLVSLGIKDRSDTREAIKGKNVSQEELNVASAEEVNARGERNKAMFGKVLVQKNANETAKAIAGDSTEKDEEDNTLLMVLGGVGVLGMLLLCFLILFSML